MLPLSGGSLPEVNTNRTWLPRRLPEDVVYVIFFEQLMQQQ